MSDPHTRAIKGDATASLGKVRVANHRSATRRCISHREAAHQVCVIPTQKGHLQRVHIPGGGTRRSLWSGRSLWPCLSGGSRSPRRAGQSLRPLGTGRPVAIPGNFRFKWGANCAGRYDPKGPERIQFAGVDRCRTGVIRMHECEGANHQKGRRAEKAVHFEILQWLYSLVAERESWTKFSDTISGYRETGRPSG